MHASGIARPAGTVAPAVLPGSRTMSRQGSAASVGSRKSAGRYKQDVARRKSINRLLCFVKPEQLSTYTNQRTIINSCPPRFQRYSILRINGQTRQQHRALGSAQPPPPSLGHMHVDDILLHILPYPGRHRSGHVPPPDLQVATHVQDAFFISRFSSLHPFHATPVQPKRHRHAECAGRAHPITECCLQSRVVAGVLGGIRLLSQRCQKRRPARTRGSCSSRTRACQER